MSDTEVRNDYTTAEDRDTDTNDDREREREREGVQTTTVVTRSKDEGLRNELSFRLRESRWSISGWKACAVETLSLGLMVAGAIFVGMHAREAATSVASGVSGMIRR